MSDTDSRAKVFRTAVNGFNKSDVLSYIEKMSFDFKNETQQLQGLLREAQGRAVDAEAAEAEAQRLAADADAGAQKLKEAEAELELMRKKAAESEQLIAAQNDALEELCSENEELKKRLSELEAQLTRKNAPTENEEAHKAQLYDNMSSRIGEVLIQANKSSDEIISSARLRAADIEADARRRADETTRAADLRLRSLYSSLGSCTSDVCSAYVREMTQLMQRLEDCASQAVQLLRDGELSVAEKSTQALDTVNSMIDGIVAEIKKELDGDNT